MSQSEVALTDPSNALTSLPVAVFAAAMLVLFNSANLAIVLRRDLSIGGFE